MRFDKLEAENFKSFERLSVGLDGHGFVKIDGVNNTDNFSESVGSGKSTIADAISYALTGETVKGNSSINDVKNMYTKGVCRVAVDFEHNGVEYQIVRGENELTIIEGGVNISKHLKRETQELINQKFSFFTPTFIGATVIIGQNMPNAFTNNKPSARKQILEELTNSSFMIEEIKTMLAERKADWQSEIGKLTTDVVVLDTQINGNRTTIVRANDKINSLRDSSEIEAELKELAEFIAEAEKQLVALNSNLTALSDAKEAASTDLTLLSTQLDDARVRHSDATMKAMESMLAERSAVDKQLTEVRGQYAAKNAEISKLKHHIQELKNAPTHCPTCKQPLPDAHTIDTTAQEAELDSLVVELNALQESGAALAESMKPLDENIQKFKQENQTNDEIEDLKLRIDTEKSRIAEIAAKMSTCKTTISNGEGEVRAAKSKESNLRVQLSEVDSIRIRCLEDISMAEEEIVVAEESKAKLTQTLEERQARLSTLNQVISFATRDFRTILLSSIIKRLDAYAKSYCRKMLDTTEIEFKDDGNNISISYRGRDFGVLSGGESQVVKMCITLALKKTLEDLVGFTTNIMFFDEILDNCDKATAQQLIELVSGLELSSTFFISHHEDVYLPVDKTWTVTKTDRISTLQI